MRPWDWENTRASRHACNSTPPFCGKRGEAPKPNRSRAARKQFATGLKVAHPEDNCMYLHAVVGAGYWRLLSAQPVIFDFGIANASSFGYFGRPDQGIAQGSVFVVFGTD